MKLGTNLIVGLFTAVMAKNVANVQVNPDQLNLGSQKRDQGLYLQNDQDLSGDLRGDGILLETSLQIHQEISIFASYLRDVQTLESRFNDEEAFSVVFAPSNEAVSVLKKKPWEFPINVDESDDEKDQDDAIHKNVYSFLSHHIYFGSFDDLTFVDNVPVEVSTVSGNVITITLTDGVFQVKSTDNGKTITANAAHVYKTVNGAIWILDSALAFP